MNLPDVPCPHDWNNCSDCANVKLCIAGLYKPEPNDHDVIILAAKISEEVVTAEAIESAHKIRGTWMEEFDQLPEGGIWEWMARYRTPHINYKEPLKAGPSEPGGGSKSKTPPKPPYKMPEYLKNWGQVN